MSGSRSTPAAVPSSNVSRRVCRALGLTLLALLWLHEPALANKFETIGGGVSGSVNFKQEWLQGFLYVVGGMSLSFCALALLVPHGNPLFLNFGNTKQSAIVLLVIAAVAFGSALML